MAKITRREFAKGSIAAMATITVAGTKSSGQVRGANDAIRVACAGLHGRGSAHVGAFTSIPNVQITYLVDPDTRTYAARLRQIRNGTPPQTIQDIRRALEDRNVDAISIAAPNHWHTLMTVWGAQAGKHVYVEKPCSHNVKEGRIALDMARKHNVIVQHGTQSRSSSQWSNTIDAIRTGKYGKLQVARALCYKRRASIGVKPDSQAPKELDFNLWLGPAQRVNFNENLVHYNWHWFWAFGNGDIGNQGVHEMDIARWSIAGATLPRSVISVGGRFGYTDQGETPNTQIAVYDFGPSQLIFEVRGLPTPAYHNQMAGNVFHMEEGLIVPERGGHKFYRKGSTTGEVIPRSEAGTRRGPSAGGSGENNHFGNFIAAIHTGRKEDLNADIQEGHYSAALCHLAHISYRLGTNAPFNPRTNAFGDNREAVETLQRMEEHLSGAQNNLKLSEMTYRVGRKLEIDARTESFNGNAEANRLLTRQYREGFVVPDRVV